MKQYLEDSYVWSELNGACTLTIFAVHKRKLQLAESFVLFLLFRHTRLLVLWLPGSL